MHSDYHAQVVDGIAKGDGPAARCVMDCHLERSASTWVSWDQRRCPDRPITVAVFGDFCGPSVPRMLARVIARAGRRRDRRRE